MHSFIALAIVALSILMSPRGANASSSGVEANNLFADATSMTFRGSNLAAPDVLPRPRQNPQTEKDELRTAIVSARISEPDRVAGLLSELRVQSIGHLGRLDQEEWSEMMAGMRGGGVALGSRNKLRLLVAAESSGSHVGSAALLGGRRRVQTGLGDEESSSRSGRQGGDSTSAAKLQESEQEPSKESTCTIFGVSGDSAPPISVPLCRARFGVIRRV